MLSPTATQSSSPCSLFIASTMSGTLYLLGKLFRFHRQDAQSDEYFVLDVTLGDSFPDIHLFKMFTKEYEMFSFH
jgi:hypothetical protein